ncbi:TLD-domain-containing protein [Glomus cerebriforme]|uniref:TLD-domain-containing protein n=1 Tax=Glomus cerebriforme TaxID=658196 RepID=A0A397S4F0_9GLOM|nr:TLD-domain-containing protein [Glomus cerebriforme]
MEYLQELSNDFGNLINDRSESNVIIQVGEEPNMKEFKAHTLILRSRSSYFRKALSKNWAKKDGDIYLFKKPNISPDIFEIILSGKVLIEGQEGSKAIELLIASDELEFFSLCKHVQKELIEKESKWLLQNLLTMLKILSQHQTFTILLEYLLGSICRNPQIIFGDHNKFFELDENIMIQLLKRDDLEMEEIDIWNYLIKWGLYKINRLDNDISNWTKQDFKELEKVLQHCIPLIRFFQISSVELYDKVRKPFKKLLPKELNEDIIRYFMKPGSKPTFPRVILPERVTIINSTIIKSAHAALISSWVDNKERNDFKKIPYEFNLLVRGSKDGFDSSTFHSRCDYKVGTVVLVKLKESQEILGGYNPCTWQRSCLDDPWANHSSTDYQNTNKSFIFSLNMKDGIGEYKLSRVHNPNNAIYCSISNGPCFGCSDLWMTGNFGSSKKTSYKEVITESTNFFANEYEVFQLIKKRKIEKLYGYDSSTIFITSSAAAAQLIAFWTFSICCTSFPMSFRRYHLDHTFQGVVGFDPDLHLEWEKKFVIIHYQNLAGCTVCC